MKRYLTILAALAIMLSAASCSGDKQNGSGSNSSSGEQRSSSEQSAADSSSEENSDYDLLGDFTKGESDKFIASDGWSNGDMFNCTWKKANCTFADGVMKLTIDKDYFGDGYTGAEYRTNDFYGYGLYEVSMKPISNNGVVSSFFTYTGPSDGNKWDEIDIEFLGKDTTKVQFNYYTDGVGNHEFLYDLGFDASKEFHTYGFKWSADSITWYVDGKEAYTATENLPSTPGKLMMNVWNGIGVDGWLNAYDGTTPLTAEYQWARFTKE